MKEEEKQKVEEPKVEDVDEQILLNELRLFATLTYCG